MFACRGFFGSSVLKPYLLARSLSDINAGASSARAYVIFNNTGQLTSHTDNTGDSFPAGQWMTGVITPAEAALYELVVVKNSGTLGYGAAGTYNLGGSPIQIGCTVAANGGEQQASVTLSIRRASDGVTLATAPMDFDALSSNA